MKAITHFSKEADTQRKKVNLDTWKKRTTEVRDPVTEILEDGAQRLLAKAIKTEMQTFLEKCAG